MKKNLQIPLFDLVIALSEAIDLISPLVIDHQKKVACIALQIASEYGLAIDNQNDILIAGALHDIGAIGLEERKNLLNFDYEDNERHVEIGYKLLKSFEPLSKIAQLIKYHHTDWNYGKGSEVKGVAVPVASHIIYLSDRIAVLINPDQHILNQTDVIKKQIANAINRKFFPDITDVFLKISSKESFWLETVSPSFNAIVAKRPKMNKLDLPGRFVWVGKTVFIYC